jgi:hypothetical protein
MLNLYANNVAMPPLPLPSLGAALGSRPVHVEHTRARGVCAVRAGSPNGGLLSPGLWQQAFPVPPALLPALHAAQIVSQPAGVAAAQRHRQGGGSPPEGHGGTSESAAGPPPPTDLGLDSASRAMAAAAAAARFMNPQAALQQGLPPSGAPVPLSFPPDWAQAHLGLLPHPHQLALAVAAAAAAGGQGLRLPLNAAGSPPAPMHGLIDPAALAAAVNLLLPGMSGGAAPGMVCGGEDAATGGGLPAAAWAQRQPGLGSPQADGQPRFVPPGAGDGGLPLQQPLHGGGAAGGTHPAATGVLLP